MSFSLPKLPNEPGVYLMRDRTGSIIYIGKAINLKKRVSSYFRPSSAAKEESSKIQALVHHVSHVDYVLAKSEREALVLERRLINRYKPTFNTMWKDDKSYPYVALTMGEDFPRLYLTRKKNAGKGTLYFGPYPSVQRVRKLLRWVWKAKLFPLRPCRLSIKEGEPYPYEKVKSCLYLHTKECPAPCLAKISKKDYRPLAERAKLFFKGQTDSLVKRWEKEMAKFSSRQEYEEAAAVRDRIQTIAHMNEQVTVREMTEVQLADRINQTRAVQELRKSLGLNKSPDIIECFDISHFQGDEKVASMVRFKHGRPDKGEYRKFIIKSVEGIDDFKAMAEVVGRRYRRLQKEGQKMPDLVLVDGGKGQLSAALAQLKKDKMGNLPLASLAKREEEVFLPGKKSSIRLPKDSLGLLLLMQVRDEAHRFAITFHRQRRTKKSLGQSKT